MAVPGFRAVKLHQMTSNRQHTSTNTHPCSAATPPQVTWVPPTSSGCFNAFSVSGKDVQTGRYLPTQSVDSGLSARFSGLASGATYEFSVQATGPAGKSGYAGARAAMPPSYLYERPDAPSDARVVAQSDSSARLTWGLPPGNPKVDNYEITAVPVNATG